MKSLIGGFKTRHEIMLILKKIEIKVKELPVKWKHRSDSKINIITDSCNIFLDLFKLRLRFSFND